MVEVGRIIKILEKMKRLSIIFTILGAIVLMASCANNNLTPETKPSFEPTPGVDVIFSTSQENVVTRTLYDGENTDGTAMRVKWVDDDRVKIFGADCSADRSVAEYSVVAAQDTDEKGEPYYYAESLTHIGEYGVQWGDSPTSDFYAIYPSNEDTNFTKNSDNSVKVTTSISAIQNVVFDQGGGIGTPVADDANNPSMPNALMYARTANAAATDAAGNPQQVNLRFKPYSTVLKFHLDGYTDDSETVEIELADITISKIEVVAPVGTKLAGKFDMNITGNQDGASATTSNITNATNVITINPLQANGSLVTISEGDYLEFDVFTIPQDNISFGDGWSVKVYVVGYDKPFTYNVKPIAVNNTYTLQAGKIHNVRIPAILIDKEAEWNYKKWMTQIPKEVYLSELSIPGAWYCTQSEYQTDTNIKNQYDAGIRAFNIDCRVSYDTVTKRSLSSTHTYSNTYSLVSSGSEKSSSGLGLITALSYTQGNTVKSKLEEIIKLVPEDEYVIVLLTIAEKPKTHDYGTGDYSFGSVDPSVVVPLIKTTIDELTNSYKAADGTPVIYNQKIDSNTTISDVLGHVIVKINTNNDTIGSYTYPTNSLVSFGSMDISKSISLENQDNNGIRHSNNVSNLGDDYFSTMQSNNMYYGNTTTDLIYYYHQAQRTTSGVNTYNEETGELTSTDYSKTYQVKGIPTLEMRKKAINDIIAVSSAIYQASSHNAWFQLGIGGYIKDTDNASTDQSSVATALNEYVAEIIKNKMENDPSPVGIVLMNNATSGKGLELTKEIVQMNNKFYLKREGGDIVTGGEGNGNGNGNGNGGGSGDGNM